MNFSIIFPTRERPHLLMKYLQSLIATTHNILALEVLIAIDDDDASYDDMVMPDFVRVFRTKRSLNFSRDYYSMLAKEAKGAWIIGANDDAVSETLNWDLIAYDILKEKPGVIYGWIEDGLGEWRAKGHGDYCCFPLLGREGVEALGYFFPARVPTWGADIWAKGLYDQVDSVVELPIVMRHLNYHNGTREQDMVSKRIAENQVSFRLEPAYNEINALLDVIRIKYASR